MIERKLTNSEIKQITEGNKLKWCDASDEEYYILKKYFASFSENNCSVYLGKFCGKELCIEERVNDKLSKLAVVKFDKDREKYYVHSTNLKLS